MDSILNRINVQLGAYYAGRTQRDHASFRAGWRDDAAQLARFKQLAQVIDTASLANLSINDLGCGLGDFSEFLSTSGGPQLSYRGYDRLAGMVEDAQKRYAESSARRFIKIDDIGEMDPADYTVASGIFNLKFTISEHEWLYYMLHTIHVMNSKSAKGFAFNALTQYSDKEFMKEELYYADPCFLFDYCKRNFSRNVALLHDYKEYDFTIIVRKD